MSDCRICDTCDNVFSILDINARRMTVEEPIMVKGSARGIQTVIRDMCGTCFTGMNKKATQPLALDAANASTVVQ